MTTTTTTKITAVMLLVLMLITMMLLMCRFGPIFQFIIIYKLAGLHGFCWASQFLSALIACERCLCVMNPIKAKVILPTRSMAVLITSAIAVIVGFHFIIVFK